MWLHMAIAIHEDGEQIGYTLRPFAAFLKNHREIMIFKLPDDSYGQNGRNFEAKKLAPTVSPSSFKDWIRIFFQLPNFGAANGPSI